MTKPNYFATLMTYMSILDNNSRTGILPDTEFGMGIQVSQRSLFHVIFTHRYQVTKFLNKIQNLPYFEAHLAHASIHVEILDFLESCNVIICEHLE